MTDQTLFVASDIHGHRGAFVEALAAAGLIGSSETWTGGTTRLLVLGDLTDRGPDGIGVIELLMRLETEARRAGGEVDLLLGNHEILALGNHKFGAEPIPAAEDAAMPRSFERSWLLNEGQPRDRDGLQAEHLTWLTSRDAVRVVNDILLLHSDTTDYLTWGSTVAEINARIRVVLSGNDIQQWWELWRRLTTRHRFRGATGLVAVRQMLATLGGSRLVHGHSIIGEQLGVDASHVTEPHFYADGLALAVDGGLHDGGPCLVVRV